LSRESTSNPVGDAGAARTLDPEAHVDVADPENGGVVGEGQLADDLDRHAWIGNPAGVLADDDAGAGVDGHGGAPG